MTRSPTRVPADLRDKFNAIAQATDACCIQRLNGARQMPSEAPYMALAQGLIALIPGGRKARA